MGIYGNQINQVKNLYSLPMFQSAGLRLFRLPVDDRGINPEDIITLYRQHRIRMLFLNPNFQNPTGTVLTIERRIRLLEIAFDLGIPIVEDDPFTLTAFDGNPPPVNRLTDARQQMDFGLSTIPQWIANQFIEDGHFQNHINQLRKGLLELNQIIR